MPFQQSSIGQTLDASALYKGDVTSSPHLSALYKGEVTSTPHVSALYKGDVTSTPHLSALYRGDVTSTPHVLNQRELSQSHNRTPLYRSDLTTTLGGSFDVYRTLGDSTVVEEDPAKKINSDGYDTPGGGPGGGVLDLVSSGCAMRSDVVYGRSGNASSVGLNMHRTLGDNSTPDSVTRNKDPLHILESRYKDSFVSGSSYKDDLQALESRYKNSLLELETRNYATPVNNRQYLTPEGALSSRSVDQLELETRNYATPVSNRQYLLPEGALSSRSVASTDAAPDRIVASKRHPPRDSKEMIACL
jgi:hypothetical protein